MRRVAGTRHFSPRTEEVYVRWIRRYVWFHGLRHPSELSERHVTSFLSHLAVEGHVAVATQNQARSAIVFLYRDVLGDSMPPLDAVVRAKRPRRLPIVLTREEVRAVLLRLDGAARLVATLLYGAGLRLVEGLSLRVKDIDFGLRQVMVRGGKGDKDRVTVLPAGVEAALAEHLERVRRLHARDLARGAGRVALPGALERKYGAAGRDWAWQWVFPGTTLYTD